MNYLHRLIWRTEDEMFNPLMHIFFLTSLVFGLAFGIAPHFFGATQTVLYAQTLINFGSMVGSFWGWGLVLVTVFNTIILATRTRFLGGVTAGIGFMLWFYAFLTYLFAQFWLGAFGAGLPNMLFWVWYYFKVKKYHRNPPEKI